MQSPSAHKKSPSEGPPGLQVDRPQIEVRALCPVKARLKVGLGAKYRVGPIGKLTLMTMQPGAAKRLLFTMCCGDGHTVMVESGDDRQLVISCWKDGREISRNRGLEPGNRLTEVFEAIARAIDPNTREFKRNAPASFPEARISGNSSIHETLERDADGRQSQ